MKIEQTSATVLAASETIKDLAGVIKRQDGHWIKNGVQVDEKFNNMLSNVTIYIKKVICQRYVDKQKNGKFVEGQIKIICNKSDIKFECSYTYSNNMGQNSYNFSIIILPKSYCFEYTEQPIGCLGIDSIFFASNENIDFEFDQAYFFPELVLKNITISATINDNNSLSGSKYIYVKNISGKIINHKSDSSSVSVNDISIGDRLTVIGFVDQEITTSKGKTIIEKRSYGSQEVVVNEESNYNITITLDKLYDLSAGEINVTTKIKGVTSKSQEAIDSEDSTTFKAILSNSNFEDKILTFTGKKIKENNILSFKNLYIYPNLEECSLKKEDFEYTINIKKEKDFPIKIEDPTPIECFLHRGNKISNENLTINADSFTVISVNPVDEKGEPIDVSGIPFKFNTALGSVSPNSGTLPIKLNMDIESNYLNVSTDNQTVKIVDASIPVELVFGEEYNVNLKLHKVSGTGSLLIDFSGKNFLSDLNDKLNITLEETGNIEGAPIKKDISPSELPYTIDNIPNGIYKLKVEAVSKNKLNNYFIEEKGININEAKVDKSKLGEPSKRPNYKAIGILLDSSVKEQSLEGNLTIKETGGTEKILDNELVSLSKDSPYIVSGLKYDGLTPTSYDILFKSDDYYKNTYFKASSSSNISHLKLEKVYHISVDSSNKPGGKLDNIILTIEDTVGPITDYSTGQKYDKMKLNSLPHIVNYLKDGASQLTYKLSFNSEGSEYNNGERGTTISVTDKPVDIKVEKIETSGEATINISGANDKPTLSLDIKKDGKSISGYPKAEAEFPHKVTLPNGDYSIKIEGSSVANKYVGEGTMQVLGKPVSTNIKLEATPNASSLVISATNEKFLGDPKFNLTLQDKSTTQEITATAFKFPHTWKNVKPGEYNLKIDASTPEAKYTLKPTSVSVKPGIKNEISVTLEEKITAKSNVTVTLNKKYEEDEKELTVTLHEVAGKDTVKKTTSNAVIFEAVNPASYTVEVSCETDDEFNKHHGKTTLPFTVKEGEPKEVTVEVLKEAYGIITVNINASSIPDTSLKVEIRENNKNGKVVDSGTVKSTSGQYVSKKILRGEYAVHAEGKNGGVIYSSPWVSVILDGEAKDGNLDISGNGSLLLNITSDSSMTCKFVLQQQGGPAKVEKVQGLSAGKTETVKFPEIPIGTYDVSIFDNKTGNAVVITSNNNENILVQQENFKLEMTISNKGNAVIAFSNKEIVLTKDTESTLFNVSMEGPDKINKKDIPYSSFPIREDELVAGKYNININSKNGAYILTKTNIVEVKAGVEFTQLELELKRATIGVINVTPVAAEGVQIEGKDVIEVTLSADGSDAALSSVKPITKSTTIGKAVKFSGLMVGKYNFSTSVKGKNINDSKLEIRTVELDENNLEKNIDTTLSSDETLISCALKLIANKGSSEMKNAEVVLKITEADTGNNAEGFPKTYNSSELDGVRTKVFLKNTKYNVEMTASDATNKFELLPLEEGKYYPNSDTGTNFNMTYKSIPKDIRDIILKVTPKEAYGAYNIVVSNDSGESKEENEISIGEEGYIIKDFAKVGSKYTITVSNEEYSGKSELSVTESETNEVTVNLESSNVMLTINPVGGPKELLLEPFTFVPSDGTDAFDVHGKWNEPFKAKKGNYKSIEINKNDKWKGTTGPVEITGDSSVEMNLSRYSALLTLEPTSEKELDKNYDISLTYTDVEEEYVNNINSVSLSPNKSITLEDIETGTNVNVVVTGKETGMTGTATISITTNTNSHKITMKDGGSSVGGVATLIISNYKDSFAGSDYVLELGTSGSEPYFKKENINVSSNNVTIEGIKEGTYNKLAFYNSKNKIKHIEEPIVISKDKALEKNITLEEGTEPQPEPSVKGNLSITISGEKPEEACDFALNLYEDEKGSPVEFGTPIKFDPSKEEAISVEGVDAKYKFAEIKAKVGEFEYVSEKASITISPEEPFAVTLTLTKKEPEPEPSKAKYVKTYKLGLTKGTWTLTVEGNKSDEGEVANYKEDESWKPDYFKVTKEIDGSGPEPEPPTDSDTEPDAEPTPEQQPGQDVVGPEVNI